MVFLHISNIELNCTLSIRFPLAVVNFVNQMNLFYVKLCIKFENKRNQRDLINDVL